MLIVTINYFLAYLLTKTMDETLQLIACNYSIIPYDASTKPINVDVSVFALSRDLLLP